MSTLTPATDLAATNPMRHPNESAEYRAARQALLVEEIELRRAKERVAQLRRELPAGGVVPADYGFIAEGGSPTTLGAMFGAHDTLVVYSYMFGPERDTPCPMCTSWMGGFATKVADVQQRVALAFTARSPIEKLVAAKQARGWTDMPVFSDPSGDYTRAYVNAEDADDASYNVFTRRDGELRHFWGEEIGLDMNDPGEDARGAIEMDPLWALLDTTPGGRGTDWYPSLTY
jgi:predicted dithiol-disulfide oxidoreductase (DUF899 family)